MELVIQWEICANHVEHILPNTGHILTTVHDLGMSDISKITTHHREISISTEITNQMRNLAQDILFAHFWSEGYDIHEALHVNQDTTYALHSLRIMVPSSVYGTLLLFYSFLFPSLFRTLLFVSYP